MQTVTVTELATIQRLLTTLLELQPSVHNNLTAYAFVTANLGDVSDAMTTANRLLKSADSIALSIAP